ncbi:Stf0 family sulfotransferase [Pseudoruegeria sp. SK021]|uniref:Stf0 family sulfotransferase n=1 Tax=Pseudoruegeria sp. SK021 TaxID=1933035 RepID=UPI000A26056D|nr:Stf0 family sulfotransferase [Pseudoruegeria sp. SK021]OSP55390.1 hypothetical protein BV911_08130 [Pseudoruegeria sp. SK021]
MWIESLKAEAYYRTWRLRHNPFAGIAPVAVSDLRVRLRPYPDRRFLILFTPRSGSSRLTDLMARTRVLSHPGESFAPGHMPTMAREVGATDMATYVARQTWRHATKGVYGAEITYAHLLQGFARPDQLFTMLRPTALIWLIRENIVAQAVSASRMVQTGQAHLVGPAREKHEPFRYDPQAIARYVGRLRWMERRSEALVQRSGLVPMRLSYEQMVATADADLLAALSAHIGSAPLPETPPRSVHRKLGDDLNIAYSERFQASHPRLMRRLDVERAALVAGLTPIPALSARMAERAKTRQ